MVNIFEIVKREVQYHRPTEAIMLLVDCGHDFDKAFNLVKDMMVKLHGRSEW